MSVLDNPSLKLPPVPISSKDPGSAEFRDLVRFVCFLIPPKASVLVLGAHRETLIEHLAPRRVVDFESKKSLDEKFDFILVAQALPYLKDIQGTLSALQKFARPQTRLVIISPSYRWAPLRKLVEMFKGCGAPRDENWLSPYDLLCLLHLSGYELIQRGSRFFFPFEVPFLTRLINGFLMNLPVLNRLCLTEYYVARPAPSLQMNDVFVSVIIPARNEKGNIEKAVTRMPRFGARMELIFVEGHSKDGTLEEIERVREKYRGEWNIQVIRQTGEGKGDAVRKGFEAARGELFMILDADLTVPPEELPKFYDALATGKGELVMGSRLVYPLEKDSMRFLNVMGNQMFSMLLNWILGMPIKDTLCGTKALFRNHYDLIREGRTYFGDFDPFGDFDLILGAAKLQLKILEIPIRYQARSYGRTNIRRFYHAWLLFKTSFFAFRKFKLV